MLFKKKTCINCQSEYDVVEPTCPVCGTRDDRFEQLKIPQHMVWLPIYKQLGLFLLGIVVLNLISFILGLALANTYEETDPTFVLIVNLVRYLSVLAMMGVLLIKSYPKFKDCFCHFLPYVVGFSCGFLLIGLNIAYSNIVSLFYTTTTNQNQSLANSLVLNYPITSLFLLSLIGPTVEELTYRVGLFTFLSRTKKWIAYLVTIIFFAIIHFNFFATGDDIINELINLPVYAMAGAALCVLYDFFGLPASLLAHYVNNFLSILPLFITAIVQKL